ncbi:MAG: biopolymer transporter ExbD [Terrimicrobiaceae bacterium]
MNRNSILEHLEVLSAMRIITAVGDLYFNKDSVSLEGIIERLKTLKDLHGDPRVFIHGDAKAEFGLAVSVLDEIRKLGITKVAIETKSR